MSEHSVTCEHPALGLVVYQPRRGFRYAMDPFLLAAWSLEGGRPRTAADLGCGSGIIALLLARQGVAVTGYDVRPEWIALAHRSAAESCVEARFELADLRSLHVPPADLALLNPPYLAAGRGRPSPDPLKAAARTELNGTVPELIAAGARLGARLCVVLPALRAQEGEDALRAAGLHIARRCDLDDALVLVEGVRWDGATVREQVGLRGPDGWSSRVQGWYARLGARLRPPAT